jgi:hypothetical protein
MLTAFRFQATWNDSALNTDDPIHLLNAPRQLLQFQPELREQNTERPGQLQIRIFQNPGKRLFQIPSPLGHCQSTFQQQTTYPSPRPYAASPNASVSVLIGTNRILGRPRLSTRLLSSQSFRLFFLAFGLNTTKDSRLLTYKT